jgi:PAS domain S-box-containing protein
MNDYHDKTKLQLIEEIKSLKNRIEELEHSEFKYEQAEKSIITNEMKLRDIIEHSSDLFYSHTPDHLITYVSPQTREFLDCEPEEAKMRWTEFVTENPGNEIGFILTNRAIKTGKIQPSYELELVGKKGRKLWVEVNEAPVIEGGKTVAIVGALTDITDRKHAEEALIESNQMLSDVLNTIPVRVFWKDLDGVYLGCNQLFARDAGRANPEKVIGDNDYNMGWAEQAELYRSDDRFVIESGQPKINYEEPQTTPEGKTIWLRTSKIPLLHSTGNIYGVLGTYEDITERKKAEEALLRSEAMFKGIFSQAPVGIELYDSEGSLINTNQEALNIFGVSSFDEVKGFKLFEDPTISEEAKIQLRNGLPIDYESEFDFEFIKKLKLYKTTKSGKCFLQIQIMPYNISDKGDRGFVVHVQNITERKQAEQALRDSEYLLSESQKVAQLGHYDLDVLTGNWTSSKILDNIFGIDDNFIKNVEGWSDILHPDIREEMLTYFNESVLKQHQKFDKEYRIIRINNGEERWVYGLGELELDSNGNPVKMIGTIQDITNQKRSEEALQKSRERYRSLYQNTPAMLHSIDQEGRLTNVSKYWLKKMGYSLNEVLGHHSTDFMTEESSSYAKEVILPKFYETGSCRDVPYQYVKKNGEVMDALLSAITENDENGELIHSLSVIIDVTDRKQAEASLRQSEARLRQVIDLVPHYIFAKDHKGRFILANSASAESMGTTPEEIIGKTELEIAPVKKEAKVFTKDDAAVISSGKRKFIPEGRFTDIEGKSHFLQTIKIPFTASGTKNPSVLGVSVDITERKKAEEAHWESEERFSRLSESAFEGIVISDGGKVFDVNDQLAKILGYKPEEMIGKTAMEFVAPESRELVMKNIQSGIEGSYEHYALKNDGSIFPVEVQAKMLPYEGRSFRVTAIRDITERKKAEEEIRKLSHSVEQSPAIVIITDTSGNIEYVNPKFEEVTGYTSKEVIGKNPNILKSGKTTSEEYEILWKTVQAGGEWHGEFHNRKKNGELYWESASITSIKDTKGQNTHYIAIKEDITGRKAMDKKLRESHNRLRSFAERLQMIREEERATIAREIHDDLGQSLTALKMDISWVKNNPEIDAKAKTAIFEKMLVLTDSTIQTVKRIATELRPGILDDLGLVPAIEWQAAEFQNRFKIKCNVSINKSDIIIRDEISIAVFRIFQEALTNVARHSGADKVDVNLNFYDDNKLIMEITDSGVGIDEEQINSSKSLGLFGMRERVNILKGKMEIVGKHGKGTKVRVSIPVSKENVGSNK